MFVFYLPSCFSGAQPLESILEFLKREYIFCDKVVRVRISVSLRVFIRTVGSTNFAMPSISSMYLVWASLSFLLTKCLDLRRAWLSTGRLYFFIFVIQAVPFTHDPLNFLRFGTN